MTKVLHYKKQAAILLELIQVFNKFL